MSRGSFATLQGSTAFADILVLPFKIDGYDIQVFDIKTVKAKATHHLAVWTGFVEVALPTTQPNWRERH